MKRLFWMLRYALILNARSGLPLRSSWDCAATSWEDLADFPMSPSEAVEEELSCWSD